MFSRQHVALALGHAPAAQCSLSSRRTVRGQFCATRRQALGLLVALLVLVTTPTSYTAAWVMPPNQISRRAAVVAPIGTAALVVDSGKADAADAVLPNPLLGAASVVTSFLKPLYALEAPLQAGSYDKAAIQARIDTETNAAPVVMYSYSLSPFCTQAKDLLDSLGAKLLVVDLGPEWIPGLLSAESAAVRAELQAITGRTACPPSGLVALSSVGSSMGTLDLCQCRSRVS